MNDNYYPGFTYADFAPQFKAEFFNATQFADIVRASGARLCESMYFCKLNNHKIFRSHEQTSRGLHYVAEQDLVQLERNGCWS